MNADPHAERYWSGRRGTPGYAPRRAVHRSRPQYLAAPREFPTPRVASEDDYPALTELLRKDANVRVMLAGFSDLFLEAAARGQIQDWAEAVSQTVKFIAGPSRLTKVYER